MLVSPARQLICHYCDLIWTVPSCCRETRSNEHQGCFRMYIKAPAPALAHTDARTHSQTHSHCTDIQTIRASDWHLQILFCSVSAKLIVGLIHYFPQFTLSSCAQMILRTLSKFYCSLWGQMKQNGCGRSFIYKCTWRKDAPFGLLAPVLVPL